MGEGTRLPVTRPSAAVPRRFPTLGRRRPPVPGRDLAARLPDFPWDSLRRRRKVARGAPDGMVDLSVGTPVDRVPMPVQAALARRRPRRPAIPTVHGTADAAQAYRDWLDRGPRRPTSIRSTCCRRSVPRSWSPRCPASSASAPVTSWSSRSSPIRPTRSGALMAGATVVRADSLTALGPERVAMIWINSPSNPTGRVLPVEHLAKIVAWASSRHRRGRVGRVLHRPRLGIDAGVDPASRGLRRRPHRAAGRAFAVQAVQHGRLPGRVRLR